MVRRFVAFLLLFVAASLSAAAEHKPLEIGQPAPDFELPGVDGKTYKLADFKDAKLLVIVFTCNHCPTAQAYEDRIIALDRDFKDRGVKLVAISPNDPLAIRLDELSWTDLSDSLEEMKIRAKDKDYRFPYLYDGETQKTSEAVGVQATPHVFIFDRDRKLRYQGRIDNSDIHEVTAHEARDAIEALLAGKPVPVETTRVFGCSTKWSDKRSTVVTADKHWDAEPVDLETIDADAVRKLAANDTEKLLLVNLWATWCGPCVEELPELGVINHMYKSRPFRFVTISVDEASAKDDALAVLKKARASNTNYLFTSTDKDKLAEALDPKWPGPLPYTVLIAPGGKVLYRHAGALEAVELKRAIADYLGRTYAAKDAKPQKSQ
jgi:peroxiredoxin